MRLPAGRRAGFTLIELTVVMTIMVIVSGGLISSLGGVGAARRVQRGAAEIAARCRHAREVAIAHNRPVRVEFDAERQAHRMTEWQTPEGATEPEWAPSGAELDDWRVLPEGVRLGRVALRAERERPYVTFATDGSADEFAVLLTDADQRRIAVHVVAVTGAAQIVTPDDGEAWAALERDSQVAP